jgi:hypothetical protein
VLLPTFRWKLVGLVEIEQATVGDTDAMDEVDGTHSTALDSLVPRQQIDERCLDSPHFYTPDGSGRPGSSDHHLEATIASTS